MRMFFQRTPKDLRTPALLNRTISLMEVSFRVSVRLELLSTSVMMKGRVPRVPFFGRGGDFCVATDWA